jgi:adenine C2-methylase RlmN of 23S rRNA A2503 and tRNA A37
MTGKSGLLRQLGSAEIVAQVVLARRIRPVKKVVFMGMEPAHNLDNVLEAIDFLGVRAISPTRTWCFPRWATHACSNACPPCR